MQQIVRLRGTLADREREREETDIPEREREQKIRNLNKDCLK